MDEPEREIETTEARRKAGETADTRAKRTLRKPNGESVEVPAKDWTAIAVHNAACPNCGITNAGTMHRFPKPLIRRYKTDGPVLRLKCYACNTTFKVVP